MSDSGSEIDESKLPDADTCDRLTKEFAEITQTDEACGHFFLQDTEWNLERALSNFFEQTRVDEPEPSTSQPPSKTFKLLSWNIDNLDGANLPTRLKAVCAIIQRELPDIVFLQEVLAETFSYMDAQLDKNYLCLSGQNHNSLVPYFTAVLLKRGSVRCVKETVIPFPTTLMGRTLHNVQVAFGAYEFTLLNAHLESTAAHSRERVKQLKQCFQAALNVSSKQTVIFGGDLNMRDKELADAGGVPSRLNDAWCSCGSKRFTEFTWDCAKNDNIHFEGKYKPRCRFDRVYYSNDGPFAPSEFMLAGMERIRSCLCFPSDHWGILATFSLKNDQQ